MNPGPDDLVFLLGAGASFGAKIPMSAQMVTQLEEGFGRKHSQARTNWARFEDLYWHVKSSILFARGLSRSSQNQDFNIESLVNTLTELARNMDHPLYPFVATWNQRFVDLAGGSSFETLKAFRTEVIRALQQWILVDNLKIKAHYLKGLVGLRRSLEHSLRIFSLNYDRCIETLEDDNPRFHVEQGFGIQRDEQKIWNYQLMTADIDRKESIEVPDVDIFLYKLHGSIDWKRGVDDELIWVPDINLAQQIDPDVLQIIFGKEAKMDARDPFSFYFSEFRRACKAASLLVVVGYSFSDTHINQILFGSLRGPNQNKHLLVVTGPFKGSPEKAESHKEEEVSAIANKLIGQRPDGITETEWRPRVQALVASITVLPIGAEEFFQKANSWQSLEKWLPSKADPFAI